MVKRSTKFMLMLTIFLLGLLGSATTTFAQEPEGKSERPNLRAAIMATLADTLGLTTDELRSELKSGKKLAEIAEEQSVSQADVANALYDTAIERLDQAVESGKIRPALADRIRQQLTERRDRCVNDGQCGINLRRLLQHLQARRAQINRQQQGAALAEALNMPVEDLAAAVRSGQTIREIAAAQGKTPADLANALYDIATERLDQAVESGKITTSQADHLRQRLTERRDACINDGECHLR